MALSTLRIFVSSPGDVAEERVIARRVIGRLDAQFGELVHLEAVSWERLPLVATATFQDQLVKPSETDIAIVILWSRLGTALPGHIRRDDGSAYASGTEFEFEDAMAGFRRVGRPHLLTYRKTAPPTTPTDLASLEESVRQQQAMQGFVARWFHDAADGSLKGAFHNFAQPAEFEDLLEAHLARLVEARLPPGATVRHASATWRGTSPFRGLEVFEAEHAPVFFGRTGAVAGVLSKLRAQAQARKAFVLVVGMSGSGKSSLMRAGVLPLMEQPGVVSDATTWRRAVFRPSDGRGHLVDGLMRVLMRAASPSDDGDVATVTDVAGRLEADDAHLALLVDQLEEAFSDETVADDDRQAFFGALDALARTARVWIVATMRSDAYPRLADAPALLALKEGDGQFDLVPPNLREIGQIIRFPAAAAGLRFEVRASSGERLDDVIRDAAAKNPGALPLLQFLLEELYKRRNDEDVLTFRAYEELGGVEGALAQRAEAVYAGVSDAARSALPAVLRELVTLGDDEKALRRIAPRRAFTTPGAIELVDALLAARLLVSTLDEHGEAAISLAHEALLEFWPRVRTWRDEDRELLLVHARVANAARAWEKEGRSADLLLARGKPLAEAKALAAAGVRLSEAEAQLVTASDRRARRFAQLRAGAVIGLGVLTMIAGVAAWRANVESKRATVQATTAQRTTGFMVSLFANADPDQSQGEKVTVREVLDRGVAQIDAELRGEDAVRSQLLRAMGQSYNGLGLYKQARDVLEEATAVASRTNDPTELTRTRMALAENRGRDGDFQEAERLYRLAQQSASHLDPGRTRDEVALLATIGIAESVTEKDATEARTLLQAALDRSIALHGERNAITVRVLDDLGQNDYLDQQYDAAERWMRRSIDIQKSLFGSRHSNVGLALNNLGSLYFQVGRYDEASDSWRQALAIYEAVLGRDHPRVAAILNNLGRADLLGGRIEVAGGELTRCLEIRRRSLPSDHPDFVLPLNSLGMVKTVEGQMGAARPLLDEALAIARLRMPAMVDQVLTSQAELDLVSGNFAEGRRRLEDARTALARQYGDALSGGQAWRVAVLETTAAGYDLQAGDFLNAMNRLTAALPLLQKRFGASGLFARRAEERLAAATRHDRSGRPG